MKKAVALIRQAHARAPEEPPVVRTLVTFLRNAAIDAEKMASAVNVKDASQAAIYRQEAEALNDEAGQPDDVGVQAGGRAVKGFRPAWSVQMPPEQYPHGYTPA